MRRNLKYLICLKVIILLCFSNTLFAKASVSIVTMEQVPYGFRTADENLTGVFYEILNNIIVASHIENKNRLQPLNRLFTVMSSRTNMCSLIADTPEIVSNLDLVEPIGLSLNLGILPKQGIKLDHYSNLKGLTIAVPLGVPLGVYFDEHFYNDKTLTIVSPRNYTNAVKLLKNGQVDAIAGSILALRYIGKTEGMTSTDFDAPLILSHNEVQLVCSRGLALKTREKLKNTVIELKSNGTIQATLANYFTKT